MKEKDGENSGNANWRAEMKRNDCMSQLEKKYRARTGQISSIEGMNFLF